MRQRTRLDRLELSAPAYSEVWHLDEDAPDLYHFGGETLTSEALTRRADTRPGLTVIRIDRCVRNPEAS